MPFDQVENLAEVRSKLMADVQMLREQLVEVRQITIIKVRLQ